MWTFSSVRYALLVVLAIAGCKDATLLPGSGISSKIEDGKPGNAMIVERIAAAEKKLVSDPCLRRDGNYWVHVGWKNCLEFLPPKRMKGVWVQDFEESSFFPNEDGIPRPSDRTRFTVLLSVDNQAVERMVGVPLDRTRARAIALEFIGRQSKHRGPYYSSENDLVVVVDRLVSAKYLGFVPDPDWLPRRH